jgi:hypothetical protein
MGYPTRNYIKVLWRSRAVFCGPRGFDISSAAKFARCHGLLIHREALRRLETIVEQSALRVSPEYSDGSIGVLSAGWEIAAAPPSLQTVGKVPAEYSGLPACSVTA